MTVQPKVRVFAWRLAHESLLTMMCKWRRNLGISSVCRLCGQGRRDGYHVVVACIKVRALVLEMHKHWALPLGRKHGADWLLVLLNSVDERMKANLLLIFWRSWHLRNDVIHNKGKTTIVDSIAE
ncbi:unnamed protein product [Cuscuta epithymum]|uniref:Reverse transcriptase zinc-binding domain-containing protein n=1 Tax=Cuscuta epithymum TaxID=186058 RepID=A0AAV0CM63_9ASTE|nr:unnamed protein product [Cuscuta epithymum]